MKNRIVRLITLNALFAALYVALTIALGDLSFGYSGLISFRVAELLICVCCFKKDFIPGAILACFLAYLLGGAQVVDIIVGTIQTAITVLILYFVKPKILAVTLGALVCGVIIGIMLVLLGFSTIGYWIILTTFAGELIILLIGFILFKKIFSLGKIKI